MILFFCSYSIKPRIIHNITANPNKAKEVYSYVDYTTDTIYTSICDQQYPANTELTVWSGILNASSTTLADKKDFVDNLYDLMIETQPIKRQSEDKKSQINYLKRNLEKAVAREDYEQAARLRDKIKRIEKGSKV